MTIRSKVFPKVSDKINGPLGDTIPAGARDYYNFSSGDTSFAILEQYGRDSSLATVRTTASNTQQLTNIIKTYGSNTASLVVGSGLLGQGPSANLLPDSLDFTQSSWQKAVTRIEIVSSTKIPPDPTKTSQVMQTLADTGQNYVRRSFTIAADGIFSIYVAKKNYRYVYLGFLGSQNVFDFDTGLFTVNNENAKAERFGDWWRLSATLNFSGAARFATMGIPSSATVLSWSSAPDAGLGVHIFQGDFLESDFVYSPDYTSSGAGAADGDTSSISTTGWAVNNFEWRQEFIYLGSDGSDATTFLLEVDGNNLARISHDSSSAKVMLFEVIIGGVTVSYTATFTNNIAIDDVFEWSYTRDSSAGGVFTITNKTASEKEVVSQSGDTANLFTLPSTAKFFKDDSTHKMRAIIKTFTRL